MTLQPGSLPGDGVREQTRQVLKNVQAVLEAAGTDLSHVLKTTCFLTDINDFVAFNEVYREFFSRDPPARSTIQAGLVSPWVVEIEAIAVVGDDSYAVAPRLARIGPRRGCWAPLPPTRSWAGRDLVGYRQSCAAGGSFIKCSCDHHSVLIEVAYAV